MRLIDADALFAKLKSHFELFKHSELMEDLIRRDEMLTAMADVINAPTVDAVFCTNCGGLVNGGNEQMDRKVKGLRIILTDERSLFYGADQYTDYYIKNNFLMVVDNETLIAMHTLNIISSVILVYEDEPMFEGEVV